MSTKRIYWVCAGSILLLGLSLFLVQLRAPSPGVTPENFRRLHRGMTEKEVEAIMGRPGGSRIGVTGSHCTYWRESHHTVVIGFSDIWMWGIDSGAQDGKMATKDGLELELRDEPPSLGLRKAYQTFKRMLGP